MSDSRRSASGGGTSRTAHSDWHLASWAGLSLSPPGRRTPRWLRDLAACPVLAIQVADLVRFISESIWYCIANGSCFP